MFLSIFVYTTLFGIMFSLSFYKANNPVKCHYGSLSVSRQRFWTWELIICILLFSFVFGVRYNVGLDWENYAYAYVNPSSENEYVEEVIFVYISKFLRLMSMPMEVAFTLWAFLQLFFLLNSFKGEIRLLPYLMFVFFSGKYFLLWMNVIRQDLATCIFIFSIQFIVKKKFWPYFFLILLATGFHYSAIALLIIYPIFHIRYDYFKKVWFQLLLLLVSASIYLANINLLGDVDSVLALYLEGGSYDRYANGVVESTTRDAYMGMSFITGFIIDLLIILFSTKLKKYYSSDVFVVFYNLYLIGTFMGLIFGSSFILLRPVRYFSFFELVVAPYALYYLFVNKFRNLFYLGSFILVILCYLYQFLTIFINSEGMMLEYQSTLFL